MVETRIVKLTRAQKKQLIKRPFRNPYCDQSDPKLRLDEVQMIERLRAGDELVVGRCFGADPYSREKTDPPDYAVYWYWSEAVGFPCQPDWPVMRLMARNIITVTMCAGGYATMKLTPAAIRVVGDLETSAR